MHLGRRSPFGAGLVFSLIAVGVADELKFNNGSSVACTILQEAPASVVVLYGSGILRIDRAQVKELNKSAAPPASTSSQSGSGIVRYSQIIIQLAKQAWAIDLHAIPATVVDNGPLKHVPYKSHRVAADCEVNVYGDPNEPACIEVGLLGRFVDHAAAKQRCMEFVATLFDDRTDKAIIVALKSDKDLVRRGALTFEITPPSAEDAYGGWWISIYNEKLLDSMRASESDIAAITTEYKVPTERRAEKPPVRQVADDWDNWHPSDFQFARSPSSKPIGSASGGRVYVHGYTRKDGTYVHPHTRKK